jgi:hypothetical protein
MRAIWNGQVLAESDQTVVVEGNHYFPPGSLRREFFTPSDTHTVCPWKGAASYYDIVVDGQVNPDAAAERGGGADRWARGLLARRGGGRHRHGLSRSAAPPVCGPPRIHCAARSPTADPGTSDMATRIGHHRAPMGWRTAISLLCVPAWIVLPWHYGGMIAGGEAQLAGLAARAIGLLAALVPSGIGWALAFDELRRPGGSRAGSTTALVALVLNAIPWLFLLVSALH